MIILNYKKILGIIVSCSILGLVLNYFNPAGIPIIREKHELNWAPDSLIIIPQSDSIVINNDSTQAQIDLENQNKQEVKEDLVAITEEESNPQSIPEKTGRKTISEEKNISSFTEPLAIKLEQAYDLFNKGVLFIDARDESDFLAGHISKSINIPFDDFDNHKQKLDQISKENPIVIYCAGTDCDLSHLLANLLFEKGYKQVYVFFGGWIEWTDANYPIEHSPDKN